MGVLAAVPMPGLLACAQTGPELAQAVRAWHADETLVRVEAGRVSGAPRRCVARGDTQEDWRGFVGCCGMAGSRIVWQAEIEDPPGEPSVLWVRGASSDVAGVPLVEVMGRTPMGNGFYHVYALEGRALRKVLETRT